MSCHLSRRESREPVLTNHRSMSPSGSFCSSSLSSSSTGFFTRPSSPTRISLYGPASSQSSVRFINSPKPSSSFSVVKDERRSSKDGNRSTKKRTCMCSPTTHPGSFRCALHKNGGKNAAAETTPYQSNRLNSRRSAMTNSLVRIWGVEGDLVKRALSALIRPSSHHQKRREGFVARPSRLSVMSKADE